MLREMQFTLLSSSQCHPNRETALPSPRRPPFCFQQDTTTHKSRRHSPQRRRHKSCRSPTVRSSRRRPSGTPPRPSPRRPPWFRRHRPSSSAIRPDPDEFRLQPSRKRTSALGNLILLVGGDLDNVLRERRKGTGAQTGRRDAGDGREDASRGRRDDAVASRHETQSPHVEIPPRSSIKIDGSAKPAADRRARRPSRAPRPPGRRHPRGAPRRSRPARPRQRASQPQA